MSLLTRRAHFSRSRPVDTRHERAARTNRTSGTRRCGSRNGFLPGTTVFEAGGLARSNRSILSWSSAHRREIGAVSQAERGMKAVGSQLSTPLPLGFVMHEDRPPPIYELCPAYLYIHVPSAPPLLVFFVAVERARGEEYVASLGSTFRGVVEGRRATVLFGWRNASSLADRRCAAIPVRSRSTH